MATYFPRSKRSFVACVRQVHRSCRNYLRFSCGGRQDGDERPLPKSELIISTTSKVAVPIHVNVGGDIAVATVEEGKPGMCQVQALRIQQEVQLRFLCPADVTEVKKLCTEWFPIEYPDSWYDDITSSSRFYSLAATHQSCIIGLIVAELKPKSKLNKEDGDILANYYPSSIQVAYILSLGVVGDFRRNGIASLLLDSLLSYLTSKERSACKAVYLHVLATNTVAIRFYEHRNFRPHSFLPFYYSIQGKPRDGFSYVLYINGGQPPWSFYWPQNVMNWDAELDTPFLLQKTLNFINQYYICHCGTLISKLQPCGLPRQLYRAVRSVLHRFLSQPPVEVSHSS